LAGRTGISSKISKLFISNILIFFKVSARAREIGWVDFFQKILTIFKAFQLGKLCGLLKWKNFANGDIGVPIILLRILAASSLDSPVLLKSFLSCALE
jgi:hypothetical protein